MIIRMVLASRGKFGLGLELGRVRVVNMLLKGLVRVNTSQNINTDSFLKKNLQNLIVENLPSLRIYQYPVKKDVSRMV